jgi:replicative DNA helicase
MIDETSIIWPHNAASERAFLGYLMSDPMTLDGLTMAPGAMYDPLHKMILIALMEMRQEGTDIEPSTIPIAKADLFAGITDIQPRIDACCAAASPASHLDLHIESITDNAIRRQRLSALAQLADAYQIGDRAIMSVAERDMARVLDKETARKLKTREDDHTDFAESFGRKGVFLELPLGELNAKTGGGVLFGDHVVIGGRSGDGKTAFASDIAVTAAFRGTPTLYISLEQRKRELRKRMISQLADRLGMRRHGLAHRRLAREDADRDKVMKVSAELTKLPLWLEDGVFEADSILRLVREHVNKHKVKAVVLDYIQRVRNPNLKGDSAERMTLADFSKRWYELTKTHEYTGFLLSQDNREQEKGQKKRRPRLADLKGSGSLEEDADKVLFVYYEQASDPDYPNHWGEVILAKDRTTGAAAGSYAKYARDEELLTFRDISDREDDGP